MRIIDIKLKIDQSFITLTAKCNIRFFGRDEIYFKFDKKYKDFILPDASPFAAALLIPSMKLGKDLIIDPPISEELYKNMYKLMKIVLSWDIGLKPITIKAKKIIKDTQNPDYTASFFSGGVDSFYTYLKNKENRNGIDYFILVNGYDIDLRNKKLWLATLSNVKKIAEEEKIKVIEAESNIHQFLEPIIVWDYTHGGCLAAIALCLRNKLKKVYIASSYTYEQQFPWGSSVETDKFWGTEKLTVIHDGCEASRVEKVKVISTSPLVLNYLRVCYLNVKGTYNCGKCDKCLRTMVNLLIANSLHTSKTFPHTIDINRITKLTIKGAHGAIFHKENLSALEKLDIEHKLQNAIRSSLKNVSKNNSFTSKIISKIAYTDFMYIRSRVSRMVRKLKIILSP